MADALNRPSESLLSLDVDDPTSQNSPDRPSQVGLIERVQHRTSIEINLGFFRFWSDKEVTRLVKRPQDQHQNPSRFALAPIWAWLFSSWTETKEVIENFWSVIKALKP
jgi:hypothetical protein